MGTNYYLSIDECPHCGRAKEKVHLGKASCGWKFLFEKNRDVYDFDSFCAFLDKGIIRDEYDRVIEKEELLDIIKSKQKEKQHGDALHIGNYDFIDCDFC